MISVAMATYNGEKYVAQQLQSIYDQTSRPDEVIIVDDRSSDETVPKIRAFIESRPEIDWKIYINEVNQGYVKNFFKAISLTKGDIIILCDQDDIWLDNKVAEIREVFNNNDVLSYHADYDMIDNKGELIEKKCIGYKNELERYNAYNFCHRLNYAGMTTAFSSELKEELLKLDPSALPTHDWVIHALAVCHGKMFVSNKVTTQRRSHSNNAALVVGKTERTGIEQRKEVVENYLDYYKLMKKMMAHTGCRTAFTKKIVDNYCKATEVRMDYLENKKYLLWLLNIRNLNYYSSYKAYFCDLLYMLGVF